MSVTSEPSQPPLTSEIGRFVQDSQQFPRIPTRGPVPKRAFVSHLAIFRLPISPIALFRSKETYDQTNLFPCYFHRIVRSFPLMSLISLLSTQKFLFNLRRRSADLVSCNYWLQSSGALFRSTNGHLPN